MSAQGIYYLIIAIVIGIITAIIHKGKGFSPIAGFLWGFFFSIIGLLVVLLEKDKNEINSSNSEKKQMSVGKLVGIFVGVGIVLIVLFFCIINLF